MKSPTNVRPVEAASIQINAKEGQENQLAEFLASGANLVADTEPQTLQWIAQRESNGRFRIVDFFANEEGREAHFAGEVAAALKEQSENLVESGWEHGVVANIGNSKVLSSVVRSGHGKKHPKLASYIQIRAQARQAEKVAEFLTGGAAIVEETEPDTVLWYALQIDEDTFAIYDVFADEAARDAHFGGAVAAALKDAASELVEGGWENGVLTNVVHADVLSVTF